MSDHPPDRGPALADRLRLLRAELRRRRLGGFLVPRADAHQGETVARCDERLAWLTGFTGSAGSAVVLAGRAALFVDGRYTLQAAREVDATAIEIVPIAEQTPEAWLGAALAPRTRLGYDSWLHTVTQRNRLEEACRKAGARLVAVAANPIDAVWPDRPPPPAEPVTAHDESLAGRSSADKRRQVALTLAEAREDAAVLSDPASVAWLLNLRGADIPFTPVARAFAVLHADAAVDLFLEPRAALPPLGDGVRVHAAVGAAAGLAEILDALGTARRRVRIDPDGAPAWVADRLKAAGAAPSPGADPCARPKACKTTAELAGIRAAHRRDGAALTRFLAWLDGRPGVGESAAAERLEDFRRAAPEYRGPSFATISAAGPNGAVVHYRVGPETDRRLEPGSLYLVDSGGQYPDGTTDVTRTVAVGMPSAAMRRHFTLVLKGHIGLATAVFPKGTTGPQLDILARRALWAAGLDYDHGTGHGVGCFLGVHEGPQRISKQPNREVLEPGMVLSNEPGYYRPGEYGIRIENLIAVRPVATPDGGERELMGFETLTLAPIDRRLVDAALLTAGEAAWLAAYHARVREDLAPLLDADTRAWLARATGE